MEVRNPRYQPPPARVRLSVGQRAQLRTALQAILAAAPTDREALPVYEITAQLRAAVPDVPAEVYDGTDVADALRALGLELRG